MPRVNWKQYDREIEQVENDDTMTQAEKNAEIREINRDLRDSYREEQERERERDFGGW